MSGKTVELKLYTVVDTNIEDGPRGHATTLGQFGSLEDARDRVPEWAARMGEVELSDWEQNRGVVVSFGQYVEIVVKTIEFPLDVVQLAIDQLNS